MKKSFNSIKVLVTCSFTQETEDHRGFAAIPLKGFCNGSNAPWSLRGHPPKGGLIL
jgi:hypothetical protein